MVCLLDFLIAGQVDYAYSQIDVWSGSAPIAVDPLAAFVATATAEQFTACFPDIAQQIAEAAIAAEREAHDTADLAAIAEARDDVYKAALIAGKHHAAMSEELLRHRLPLYFERGEL